jgi:hypothetical protein
MLTKSSIMQPLWGTFFTCSKHPLQHLPHSLITSYQPWNNLNFWPDWVGMIRWNLSSILLPYFFADLIITGNHIEWHALSSHQARVLKIHVIGASICSLGRWQSIVHLLLNLFQIVITNIIGFGFFLEWHDGTPLFFKMSLVGTLNVAWCSKRIFPTRVTQGLYQTLGEDYGGSFSSHF